MNSSLIEAPELRLEESLAGFEPLTANLHAHVAGNLDLPVNLSRVLSKKVD